MSVVVFINGRNSEKSAVKNILSYVKRPEATLGKFIYGNGLDTEKAYEDMMIVQSLYRKKNIGKRYIHYVLSFDCGVTSEKAFDVAKEVAAYPKYANDYQYLLALHTNTNNFHAHIILNPVNVHTLGKFSQSISELDKFKEYADEILEKHHLNSIRKLEDIKHENSFTDEELDKRLELLFWGNRTDSVNLPKENLNVNPKDPSENYKTEDERAESFEDNCSDYYDDEDNYCYEDDYEDNYCYENDDFFWDDEAAYEEAEEYSRLEREGFSCIEKGEGLPEGVDCENIYDHYEQFCEAQKTEEECIQEAEIQSSIEKRIIAFFEGERADLPEGIAYNDALEFWIQWKDANTFEDFW